MKRQIEFRGWCTARNEWVYGDLKQVPSLNIISINEFDSCYAVSVHPDSVGQWTGLLDSKGNKIFEGDCDQDGNVVIWCDNSHGWQWATYDSPTKEKVFCHCYNCEGNFNFDDRTYKVEITGNTFIP